VNSAKQKLNILQYFWKQNPKYIRMSVSMLVDFVGISMAEDSLLGRK